MCLMYKYGESIESQNAEREELDGNSSQGHLKKILRILMPGQNIPKQNLADWGQAQTLLGSERF